MAIIYFNDGTRKEVSHNQAAKIMQILNGEAQPENIEQELFVANIKDVVFRELPAGSRPIRQPKIEKSELAAKIKEINQDQTLSATEKFRKIGDLMRGERS